MLSVFDKVVGLLQYICYDIVATTCNILCIWVYVLFIIPVFEFIYWCLAKLSRRAYDDEYCYGFEPWLSYSSIDRMFPKKTLLQLISEEYLDQKTQNSLRDTTSLNSDIQLAPNPDETIQLDTESSKEKYKTSIELDPHSNINTRKQAHELSHSDVDTTDKTPELNETKTQETVFSNISLHDVTSIEPQEQSFHDIEAGLPLGGQTETPSKPETVLETINNQTQRYETKIENVQNSKTEYLENMARTSIEGPIETQSHTHTSIEVPIELQPHTHTSNKLETDFIEQDISNVNPYSKNSFPSIDPASIPTEFIQKYTSLGCAICQEDLCCDKKLGLNCLVRKLTCNHIFHNECIWNWIANYQPVCPLCKQMFFDEADTGSEEVSF